MNTIVAHTHTGLGDHIITNGMIHSFAEDYDKVYVPHIKMFGESVRSLYAGYDKIETVEFPDIDINLHGQHLIDALIHDTNSEVARICDPYLYYPRRLILDKDGKLCYVHTATNFDRQFYELAGMHFSYRYTKCRIPPSTDKSNELYQTLSKGKNYILVHSNSSQSEGYPLSIDSNLPVVEIKPGITDNVFDFVDLIRNATEVHVVGSFFQCLVDSMWNDVKGKLFFHNIMMKHDTQINCIWNNNSWNVVEYDRKY